MVNYARYGLLVNPFESRELNPLRSAQDEALIFKDSCFLDIKAIDDALVSANNKDGTTYFLIAGRSGTGRTSIANYIFQRFCEIRGFKDYSRFVVPNTEYNNDPFDVYTRWVADLLEELDDRDIKLGDLEKELREKIEQNKTKHWQPDFRGLLRRMSDGLSQIDPPAVFGVIFEDIRSFEIIQSALDVFRKSKTVVVFTALDYEDIGKKVIDSFAQNAENTKNIFEQFIRLKQLTGAEVNLFAQTRWLGDSQFPFDEGAVCDAFKEPACLGKILHMFWTMIEFKLSDHPEGEPWPNAAELAFTADEIQDKVKALWRRKSYG